MAGWGEGEVTPGHCRGCGGTGEEYGLMLNQPPDLPGEEAQDCKAIASMTALLLARHMMRRETPELTYVDGGVKSYNASAAAFVIKVGSRFYTVAVARMHEEFKPL